MVPREQALAFLTHSSIFGPEQGPVLATEKTYIPLIKRTRSRNPTHPSWEPRLGPQTAEKDRGNGSDASAHATKGPSCLVTETYLQLTCVTMLMPKFSGKRCHRRKCVRGTQPGWESHLRPVGLCPPGAGSQQEAGHPLSTAPTGPANGGDRPTTLKKRSLQTTYLRARSFSL